MNSEFYDTLYSYNIASEVWKCREGLTFVSLWKGKGMWNFITQSGINQQLGLNVRD